MELESGDFAVVKANNVRGLLRKHHKTQGKASLYQVFEFVHLHEVAYACTVRFQGEICVVE